MGIFLRLIGDIRNWNRELNEISYFSKISRLSDLCNYFGLRVPFQTKQKYVKKHENANIYIFL